MFASGRRSRSLWFAVMVWVSGCRFQTLQRGIVRAGELAALEGRVAVQRAGNGPIVVAAYRLPDGPVADLFMLPRAGSFFFALPAGTYRVGAFEDRNRDFVYQAGEEPAALFATPAEVVLRPGERRDGCDLTLDATATVRLPFAVSAGMSDRRQTAILPELQQQLGTLAALDDPRFCETNGQLGLWDPLRFLSDVGAGIYFVEEYDPQKTPVLFVHGATGNPSEWTYLIERIDRRRFQPWLLFYPSAAHLDIAGRWLARGLSALQVKYGFTRLVVVAHSMGGLVARAAINHVVASVGPDRIVQVPAFVSIATPWNGHTAAAMGVKNAPAAAPSWEDLVPGSSFLSSLPQTALPPECEFALFFSYRGGSAIVGEANDGAVAVSSELAMPVQRQASRVVGFDETHRSILRSAEVSAELNAILLRASR